MSFGLGATGAVMEAPAPVAKVVLQVEAAATSRPSQTEDDHHLKHVVTGIDTGDLDVPEITPMRTRTPPITPPKSSEGTVTGSAKEDDLARGRLQPVQASIALSAKAKKKRKKKTAAARVEPAMNFVAGFTPSESGGDESDYVKRSPKILSPVPRLAALAGASPGLRPASPGVSSLKAQLDALDLNSEGGSRSASRSRLFPGSEVPSSAASITSEHNTDDSNEDMVSYQIPIDQDFISQAVVDNKDGTSSSVSTLCPDQLATNSVTRKMTAADFTPIKCLGDGAFGIVHLVRQNATGRLFAQKQLTKAHLTVHKKRVEMTKSERSILELVNRHPFIVDLYYAFQDREKLYLILQYAEGGELFHHLEVEKFFTEDTAAFYLAEIVLALDYLHNTVGVIYRDLKPENCLLDGNGHLLLTDFGLSKVAVQDPNTPGGSRCNSLGIGTFEYMAPEIIKGCDVSDWGPGYGKACDWWSLGALACDLMTGSPPFTANNTTKLQENILKQKLKLPYYLSLDAKDFLTRLLRKEPAKRLGVGKNDISVIKRHRLFRKLDWARLEAKELEPPIRPIITKAELAENFSEEFTNRPVHPVPTRGRSRTLSVSDPFGGFSFVAPSSLLQQGLLSQLDEALDHEELHVEVDGVEG